MDKVELDRKEERYYLIVVCSHFARRLPKLPFPNDSSNCIVQNIRRYKYARATLCQRWQNKTFHNKSRDVANEMHPKHVEKEAACFEEVQQEKESLVHNSGRSRINAIAVWSCHLLFVVLIVVETRVRRRR